MYKYVVGRQLLLLENGERTDGTCLCVCICMVYVDAPIRGRQSDTNEHRLRASDKEENKRDAREGGRKGRSGHEGRRVGSSLDVHAWSSLKLGAASAYEFEEVKSVKVNFFCTWESEL